VLRIVLMIERQYSTSPDGGVDRRSTRCQPVTPGAMAIAKDNVISRRADRIFNRLAGIPIVKSN
jgi:hypothetical protein